MSVSIEVESPTSASQVVGSPGRLTYVLQASSGGFLSLETTINGQVAQRPDFSVRVTYSGDRAVVVIVPRRAFRENEDTFVAFSGDELGPLSFTCTSFFHVSKPDTRISSLWSVDTTLAQAWHAVPALDVFRLAIRELCPPTVPQHVELLYRVKSSCLRAAIVYLEPPAGLVTDYTPTLDPSRVISRMQTLEPFLRPALLELKQLDAEDAEIDLLRQAFNNGFPTDRLGSVAYMVLLAASRLNVVP